MTVMHNMYQRMKLASQAPATVEERASSDLSMVHYVERFGSFGNAKDMGVAAYAVAFLVDCDLKGDFQGLREHLALLVVGLEQYSQDTKWDLGFILMLLEGPPINHVLLSGESGDTGGP